MKNFFTHFFNILKKAFNKLIVNKLLTIVIIILAIPVIIFLFSLIFKMALNEATQNIKDGIGISTRKDDQQNKDKFDNPQKENIGVIVDQIEWKVLDAKNYKDKVYSDIDKDYCKPNEGNNLIYIKYSLRNADRSFLTVPKYNLELYDSDKNTYKASVKTYKCVLNSSNITDRYAPDILKKEEEKTYEVLYEVPNDKKDFRLKVGDLSVLGKEFEYIKLDL